LGGRRSPVGITGRCGKKRPTFLKNFEPRNAGAQRTGYVTGTGAHQLISFRRDKRLAGFGDSSNYSSLTLIRKLTNQHMRIRGFTSWHRQAKHATEQPSAGRATERDLRSNHHTTPLVHPSPHCHQLPN
jgi:hypothetical protein